jgi:hypothetical protein
MDVHQFLRYCAKIDERPKKSLWRRASEASNVANIDSFMFKYKINKSKKKLKSTPPILNF